MASVENRIVQMQFDNGAFEKRMSETLRSLDKLNTTLANTGARNGLQQVAESAKSFNLGPVAASVEGISAKFLALSTIAITALSNIVNRAVDAGMRITRAFTFEPVTTGFAEFELKMGSIQTIMAGSGADLETVNQKLEELNQYADRTIYSFADMTTNIGKFTNAGVSLDESVAAIQGVANVAALSGANAGEASRAMYNFAQAISTGTVKLIDWKSIELANMGTVEFKQQLIDSAVAMGTLTQTSDGYITSAGTAVTATQGFNQSLTDGWLTSEALIETLGRFSDASTDIGARATAAAQDVKTFSQMIDTLKESAGSGWAQTWELIIGDFEEGKALWTSINDEVGGWISGAADARNALLQGWKAGGGRDAFIEGLKNLANVIGEVITPLKLAFRDIFPPMTVERLINLTERFRDFMQSLFLGEDTMGNLRRIFRGFFSVLEIGWTVIKEGIGFIGDLWGALTGGGTGGQVLSFIGSIGDFFTSLNEKLVAGGGIKRFFDDLGSGAGDVVGILKDLVTLVVDFFRGFGEGSSEAAVAAIDRIKERFSGLSDLFANLGDFWGPFRERMQGVTDILDRAWEAIKTWFSELGTKLSEVFGPGDFNDALDGLNTGLLGGILLLLRKFVSGGLNLDFGGVMGGITQSLEQLTGVLSAMQTNIKANALLKIAGAMGILALSLILLATMDSEALTRSMTAMGTGFAILITAFKGLNMVVIGPGSAAKMSILAGGLVLLAGSMLVLSGAVKNLADLSWNELIKGLGGVGALLAFIVISAGPLQAAAPGLIRAGVGIAAIGIGLSILAGAVAIFGSMNMDLMGKGLYGVASSLVLVGVALKLMPPHVFAMGAGLILIATGLNVLALAVRQFGSMNMDELGKGLFGVASGLVMLSAGLKLIPPTLAATGAGLIIVSVALLLISKAMQSFAGMSWDEIGRGLYSMAASLTLLGIALKAMTTSIAGAAAVGVAAISLGILVQVIKQFANMSIANMISGLVGMAAAFAVIGLAAHFLTPVIPAMLGLGAAMILVGGGFALFGAGAALVAKAFELIGRVGVGAVEVLIKVIDAVILKLPALVGAFALGLIELAQVFIENTPILVQTLTVLLDSLLQAVIDLVPKIGETVSVLITAFLNLIREKIPEFMSVGWELLVAWLQGVRDNIEQVTTLVGEIVTAFLTAFEAQIPDMTSALVGFLQTVFTETARGLGELVPTLLIGVGTSFLSGLWVGIKNEARRLFDVVTGIVTDVIDWFKSGFGIFSPSRVMIEMGKNIIQGLINGLVSAAVALGQWFIALPGRVLGWIGNVGRLLWEKGTSIIGGLLGGVINKALDLASWVKGLPGKIVGWIGNVARTLWDKGTALIFGFLGGVASKAVDVANWFRDLPGKVLGWIGNVGRALWDKGVSLVSGFIGGIGSMFGSVRDAVGRLTGQVKGSLSSDFGIRSPSRWAHELGENLILGLQLGIRDTTPIVTGEVQDLTKSMTKMMQKLTESLTDDISNPTITPVMDLTQITKDAKSLSNILDSNMHGPQLSYAQANLIASTRTGTEPSEINPTATSSELKFEQNIYAPQQLSTGDIYKQTRNQIAMAKEELNIP